MVFIFKEASIVPTDNITSYTKINETADDNVDSIEIHTQVDIDAPIEDEFELFNIQGVKQFAGFLRRKEKPKGFNRYIGFDYGIALKDISVRKNFINYSPEGIIEELITDRTPLTYNSTVTSGVIIKLYPAKNRKISEIIRDMHLILGTVHRVDSDKDFFLEYDGENFISTITLQQGNNFKLIGDGWVEDTDVLCNRVNIEGDIKNAEETELKSGTGAQTVFTVANPYINIEVQHPLGTILIPEVEGIRDGDYRINKETGEIIFTVAPANGVNNIQIRYTYETRVNFTATRGSILPDNSNLHEKTIRKQYLKEVIDCKKYSEKFLDIFSKPILNGKGQYNSLDISGLSAGSSIRVVDDTYENNGQTLNKVMIITSIDREFGTSGSITTIGLSDDTGFDYNRQQEINQRLKEFEETISSADLFNEGLTTETPASIEIEYDVEITVRVATLPTNILVYDANRKYINEADIGSLTSYFYINEQDFIDLFEEI